MLYFLAATAIIFFITHITLLIASFTGPKFASSRYFYSHLTLWITGFIVLVLAICYSGTNQSQFLDYFNTPLRKGMILIVTFTLSLAAHLMIKFLVMPSLVKNNKI